MYIHMYSPHSTLVQEIRELARVSQYSSSQEWVEYMCGVQCE